MKRISLFSVLLCLTTLLFSQFPVQPISILDPEEEIIGKTWYDLQTNAASQNRIYVHNDGTIGATYTIGFDFPNFTGDLGTGYNYFDGIVWNEWPIERIESMRSSWPSYAPLGENGEIVISHLSGAPEDGLMINKRETKGNGDWTESLFQGPSGHEGLYFPRMVTGGENNNHIYLISQTGPYWITYQGLSRALLYSRSTDGGETWDIQNQILPGMDSTEYSGFSVDSYTFAEPKDSIVAFVCGSYQHDLFLMKSTDYGQIFEKTIIWDHPYDLITPTFNTDTFYCVDGSVDVALDMTGKAHVVFGIMRTYFNGNDWVFFKLTDGIGYWNESMPTFSSNVNALDPTCGTESELIVDESLIGWTQDLNNNGTIELIGDPTPHPCFYRSLGVSSMVQLVSDELNRLFLVFSSMAEVYDNGGMNYRRLFFRSSLNNGQTWGQFYHYAENDPTTIFNEYAFPSCASYSDENIYLIFQVDSQPGIDCQGTPQFGDMLIYFSINPKDEIVGIKQSKQINPEIEVYQNFPNPFSESTTIKVNLQKPADIKLEVINMLGENVYERTDVKGNAGLNTLNLHAKGLSPGIYFYTIKSSGQTITRKMIINK